MSGIQVLSAGTNRGAEEPLTDELVEWADTIFAMERVHRAKLQSNHRTALKNTRIVVLDIPDEFDFMDPKLVRLLRSKTLKWMPKA
ncbi:MAG: phosphotyrosine protein phosphatase [Erythrobacter sp.]